MSLATRAIRGIERAIAKAGSSAVLTSPGATDDDTGTVTEVPVSTTLDILGPIAETTTSEPQGANATFYAPADGLTTAPRIGHRITQAGRVWLVKSIDRHAVSGTAVLWELGCSETAEVTA